MDHRHIFFFDPLKIEREEISTEAGWNIIKKAGRGVAFIGAQNPAAAFLADIPLCIVIAQHRVLGVGFAPFDQGGIWFGHDILVFDRDGRYFNPQQAGCALCVIASGRHNMFGDDVKPLF